MAYQSQDIIRRSATNGLTPAPQARDFQEEVAKLIDVTTCIGCKACQVACSEWNDIRDTVGNNIGVYDNPNDLSAKSWTVMRFSEVEQNDKLEWLIRKDGCMHCSDPGCLKACPAEGQSFSMPTVSSTSSPSSALAAVIALRAVRSTFRASTRKTTASTNVRCALTAWWLGKNQPA